MNDPQGKQDKRDYESTTIQTDVVVIGAGAIGLAIARELAKHHHVMILERESQIGSGISSRNSEVIHAGIYHHASMLKAELCQRGKHLLYEYCDAHRIGYQRCGKILVSNDDGASDQLDSLCQRAMQNGVDLAPLSSHQLAKMEPEIRATASLYSASSGIIDSHQLMQSLLQDAESQGAELALHCTVEHIHSDAQGHRIDVDSAGEPCQIRAPILINAAGLNATELALRSDTPSTLIPKVYYCKGSYFGYTGKNPFSHLIYPLPNANMAGLGIHATLDIQGQLRFGPDVEYLAEVDSTQINYAVNPERSAAFYQAIRSYFPALDDNSLVSAYSGVRPKLSGPGQAVEDFMILSEKDHHQSGLIHLFGIESPGLTASLAIAAHVAKAL